MKSDDRWIERVESQGGPKIDPATGVTPVAGSIFGPISQTHIQVSKRVLMNEISSSGLFDIQLTLLCVCALTGVKVTKQKKFSSAYQLANIQIFCTG